MKNFTILLFLIIYCSCALAQNFNFFLSGNAATTANYDIYYGSNKQPSAKQSLQIKNKYFVGDTTFIEYINKVGNKQILYTIKSFKDTVLIELVKYLDIENYVKSSIAQVYPLWWLGYPSNLKVGDTLPSYSYQRKMGRGLQITSMSNRVVEGIDTITTKMGKIACYRITAENISKGPQGTFHSYITEWICKEYGLVKQETSSSKNRVEISLLLEYVKIY